ncbi:MAG: hypothetical protein ACTSRZ_00325 [Promethearchaeota archaeon]
MFGRIISKGLKNITIDSKRSHIFLKDTNFSLVIMRPYDLVQLGDLVGSGSEDILIWTGKTIGKTLCNNIRQKNKVKTRKKLFEILLNNLTNLGYGKFKMTYIEGKKVDIIVENSIVQEIHNNEDAILIKNLYNGIFLGAFISAGADIEEKDVYTAEIKDPLKFEYEFVEEEVI